MPYFTTRDSTSLYYEDTGTGMPLLFVHGWSFSSQVWSLQKSYLSSRYRCITLDLRGHGLSMPSRSGYSLDVLSSDVIELFERLCLTNATLVGWSLGVLVALAAYPSLRENLSAMVFVSGTSKYCASEDYQWGLPPKEPKSLSLLLKRNSGKAMDGFRRRMFTGAEASERGFEAFEKDILPLVPHPAPEIMIQSLETLVKADVRPLLATIQAPVLIVHGDSDRICPVEASQYMTGQIAGAILSIQPGAGHAPIFSRPNEFNTTVETFLENIYGNN
jgi:pimeloyl-[acyl-carrier protein] methyl ester esterase